MKKLLCCLGLSLVFCLSASAAEIDSPHISVIGTATEEIIPDKMLWHIEAHNINQGLQEVSADHKASVDGVFTLLKKVGVPDDQTRRTRMSFGENSVFVSGQYLKEGYFARTTITFILKDFEKYSEIWMGLSEIPGISIKSVGYNSTKRIETRDRVRKQALLNAKEKAEALANTLSAQLGEVLIIEDNSYAITKGTGPFQYTPFHVKAVHDETSSPTQHAVALGKIPIVENLAVVFRLVTKE